MAAGTLASKHASAALPIRLVDSTAKVAVLVARNQADAGLISTATLLLSQGVLRAMLFNRIRIAASALFLVGSFSAATAWSLQAVGEAGPPEPAPAAAAKVEVPRSPLDALRAADIPAGKRVDMPEGVVAVLGGRRGRHAGAVYGLAFTPNGKTLVTCADDDKKIRLWDPATLEPIGALAGHRAFVNCIAISPDGRRLASGSGYGDFLVWDLTVEPPRGPTRLIPPYNCIHARAFSADSKILAIAGDGKGAGLYDVSSPKPIALGPLPGFEQEVHSLSFSPVGTTLALAGLKDGSVRLWDIAEKAPREAARLDSGPMVVTPEGPTRQGTIAVGFAPDGKALAALQNDGRVRIWDIKENPPVDQGLLEGRNQQNIGMSSQLWDHATVAVAPAGKAIAASQRDGLIRIWDLGGDAAEDRTIPMAHSGGTGPLTFSTDGKTLISGGGDHLLSSWDLSGKTPREVHKPQGPLGGLKAVAFSPDGKTLAAGGDDELVQIWDLTDPRAISRNSSPTATIDAGPVQAIAFGPDGKARICGDAVWDVSRGEPRRDGEFATRRVRKTGSLSPASFNGPWSLSLTADGQAMGTSGSDRKIRIWDLGGPKPEERLILDANTDPRPEAAIARDDGKPSLAFSGPIPVVAISPDGKRLAFSGPENSIRLWDLVGKKPKELAQLDGTERDPSDLAFSPDGKLLAVGTIDGTPIWDVSGKMHRKLHWFRPTTDAARSCVGLSLAFTPDGKTLIAADQVYPGDPIPSRPAVCAYDVATGRRLHEWALSAPCWSIALAPDGRHVAAAQRDGIVVILRLP